MKTVPLRRVVQVVPGQSPASDDVAELAGGLPFIQGNAEFSDTSPHPHLQCDVATKRAEAGDLLLSVRAPVGAMNWADQRLGIGRGVAALRPLDAWDRRFVAYGIRSVLSDLRSVATGSTFEAVTSETLGSLRLPVAEPAEQRRISDFLDDRVARIDRIIAARREQLVGLRAAFESARCSLVLGVRATDTVETALPWARFVGADRKVRRLSHLARMGSGHTPSRSKPEFWIDCDIPWLTTGDVHRFRHDEIDELHSTAVAISDLGLANSAAVLHPARTVALSRTASAGFSIIMGTAMATSQDYVAWTCGPDLKPEFLLASLRVMRPFLLQYLAMGSTHKTIYFPDLMDLSLPVPPMDDQDEAVGLVAEESDLYLEGVAVMTREIDLLGEYKTSLITAAVSGELDVTTAGSNISG